MVNAAMEYEAMNVSRHVRLTVRNRTYRGAHERKFTHTQAHVSIADAHMQSNHQQKSFTI